MKYYDEDTVYELMSAAEESATAYEFGVHKSVDIKDYPSIEIKEPHGRLIDADTLADDFSIQLAITSPYMQKRVADEMVASVRLAVEKAPTILEASVNNDDDHSYEMQSDMRDYCERYEPTYNPEDGSM